MNGTDITVKVSGTNWLCIKMPDGAWLPAFKLTDLQVREYIECTDIFKHIKRIS
jgi:predicted secreted hydrolase